MAMPPQFTTLGVELRRRPTSAENNHHYNTSKNNNAAAAAVPAAPAQDPPEVRPARSSRRVTSYHNAFQTSCAVSTDEPPPYATALRTPARALRAVHHGKEALPKYTCTVGMEGKLLLNLESTNPLHGSCQGEWREVYVVVRGTMISFHRVTSAGGAGKLLRSYTLQHAEVGLASDVEHTILVPQSRLAQLIPSSARRRAWQRDPDLYRPVGQHILRLRIETDQIILADACEDRIWDLINTLSAGIDISQPLDERSIPKQCTVPRRRRRQRPHHANVNDLSDAALLAEQERIFRHMYPDFAGASTRPGNTRTETQTTIPQNPEREEDEVDISMMREEVASTAHSHSTTQSDEVTSRPANVRQTTSTTINSVLSEDMMYSTPTTNFNEDGKWQPPHLRTPAQLERYIRRCMPTLNADATRASDILMVDGRRMKLNWRMELLEPWELQPPAYKAHNFGTSGTNLVRASSQRSSTASAGQAGPQSSSSMVGDCDPIMPLGNPLEALHLTKVVSVTTTMDKDGNQRHLPTNDDESKTRRPQQTSHTDAHGVVFCF